MLSFLRKGGNDLNRSPQDFLVSRTDADVVIDVRTPAEFAEGHLAGAENIDIMAPDFVQQVQDFDREATYYLYCRSGGRSGRAADVMRKMGFDKAYNIGGFQTLAAVGAPVE